MHVVTGGCTFDNQKGKEQSFIFPTEWWDSITISEGAVLTSSVEDGSDTNKSFLLTFDNDQDRVGLYFPEELGVTSSQALTTEATPHRQFPDAEYDINLVEVISVAACVNEPMFTDGTDLNAEANAEADAEALRLVGVAETARDDATARLAETETANNLVNGYKTSIETKAGAAGTDKDDAETARDNAEGFKEDAEAASTSIGTLENLLTAVMGS